MLGSSSADEARPVEAVVEGINGDALVAGGGVDEAPVPDVDAGVVDAAGFAYEVEAVAGEELVVGDAAPDFELLGGGAWEADAPGGVGGLDEGLDPSRSSSARV